MKETTQLKKLMESIVRIEEGDGEVEYQKSYEIPMQLRRVQLAGDGWDDLTGVVTIESITVTWTVYDDDDYVSDHIYVGTDHKKLGGMIYGDSAFQEAVSNIVGADVSFTEQGMQDEDHASMEFLGDAPLIPKDAKKYEY